MPTSRHKHYPTQNVLSLTKSYETHDKKGGGASKNPMGRDTATTNRSIFRYKPDVRTNKEFKIFHLHPNVYSSSVHNSQTMKRTEVSINRWWVDNHILLKKIQSSSLLMQKLRLNKKSFPLVLASDVLLRHHNLIQALSPNPSFP